ncbi:MAG: Asp-tRNA(Asn)/Glu-tRNA(Gln) amidotransferase GatCAB subunit B, partial [Candidatus Omnitrophica bacterium]|nr:Asp-tRNA(Asn)/Glu-tRNA(Gln) amidotransferase GatCAB subunit B [Candidatus Omnitrophota bacterium]
TESMRSKEGASDYRYFPEPDLVPFVIQPSLVAAISQQLPVLPAQRRARLVETYGLSSYDAHVLTQHRCLAELFESTVARAAKPKPVANWIMGELLAYLNTRGKEPEDVVVQPGWLVRVLEAIDHGTISGKMAKEIFTESLDRQVDPQQVITEKDLRQIVDDGALERLADEVIAGQPRSVEDYRKGKQNALMFLVGKCMERSRGRANPTQLIGVLKRRLNTTP